MTIQVLYILRKIKKAQRSPDGTVYIDWACRSFCTVADATHKTTTARARILKNGFESAIRHLICRDLACFSQNESYIQLNHAGYHFGQITVWKFLKFLGHSVIVPIIVSILTTIVLHRMGG